MQKFTRPITREIELAGERLALTVGADGISVRPVGSRKPPHEIGWAALVCALTKSETGQASPPGADEVAAAVEVLKKGGPPRTGGQPPSSPAPSAPPPSPAPAAEDVQGLLGRLEKWLARHRRHFLEGLLPGADPAALEELQRHIGVPLPASLHALLAWHNGQSPESQGRFVGDWFLMGTGPIADAKRELDAGGQESGWQRAWVPFLDNDAGDYVCLDTAQPGTPVREFWQDRNDHPVVAASLEAWLADVVAAMERGDYHEDPDRGSFLRK
jgi:cell wall assembly regulator SMI1